MLASSTPAQAAADAAITGTVRGPDGPARNVEVWAVEIASRAGADATTDQSGAFAIDGLPPGDYQLAVVVYQPWDSARLLLPDGRDAWTATVTIP